MRHRGSTAILALLLASGLILPVTWAQDRGTAASPAPAPSPTLTAQDKELLTEALRLKRALGDEVWPGFAAADIPVIIYNEGFEFLTGAAAPPPPPWVPVEGDSFAGAPYARRAADKPQAFAVKVGDQWAGSMTSLETMNRKTPFQIAPNLYGVLILHEVFHAFQARQAPTLFRRALESYAFEKDYPSKDQAFAKAWTDEGAILARALRAGDREGRLAEARAFLESRSARRASVPSGGRLADYERALEWLEGLGKYAETRFYELAAARRSEPGFAAYRPGLPYFAWDLVRLERQLGAQQGDLRFYLSGMAQAMILDRLSPGWKSDFFKEGRALEALLEDLARRPSR